MSIRILTGDVREVLPMLPADSFDAIVADPPYGETSLAWDRWPDGWPALCRRVLKPTGSMWVFGSLRMFLDRRDEFIGWRMSQDVVWEKHNGSGAFNDRFRRVHENAVHFYRDDSAWATVFRSPQFTYDARARNIKRSKKPMHWGSGGEGHYRSEDGGPRLMRSVLAVRSEHGRAQHPTQKPIGILEPLVAYACPAGGHVLDPFAGSGSTGLACRLHGFDATLVELNPAYVEIAQRRIDDDAPMFAEPRPSPSGAAIGGAA